MYEYLPADQEDQWLQYVQILGHLADQLDRRDREDPEYQVGQWIRCYRGDLEGPQVQADQGNLKVRKKILIKKCHLNTTSGLN